MGVGQNPRVQQQLQEQLQLQTQQQQQQQQQLLLQQQPQLSHSVPVGQIQLPSQPLTQPSAVVGGSGPEPRQGQGQGQGSRLDPSVPVYMEDTARHEVVEGQTAKILLQLNPKIGSNVSPPVVLPSSSVSIPVTGPMIPPSAVPFHNAQVSSQPLPPPHPASLPGPVQISSQSMIPIQATATPPFNQQVAPHSVTPVSGMPVPVPIPTTIQSSASVVPSLQATASASTGSSTVLSRTNSRSNTNESSATPSPGNDNKNKSLTIDNILAKERKLKTEAGASTRSRAYKSPGNRKRKSRSNVNDYGSSGNGSNPDIINNAGADGNVRSLSVGNSSRFHPGGSLYSSNNSGNNNNNNNDSKGLNLQQKFILTPPTVRNFNRNFTKTYITTPNLSPWFTFSRDKYRFHRRYQNILPYYLGTSVLSELPPEVIKMNNLEVPRVQNYGWNMAGGHYLRLTARITRDMAHGLSTIINFDNPTHLSIINKLLKYYFDTVNKPFSIIYESMFWQQFNNGFLQQGKTNNKSTKLFSSMLYLMIITALRFKDGETRTNWRNPEDTFFTQDEKLFLLNHEKILEENLFNYSYFVVSKLTFEWESFELIQSWLLICFYLRTCYRQIACWNALSKAVTMCRGMGLNLNQLPEGASKNDEMKAWHCYWLVFIMDKLISFQIGRQYQLGMPLPNMMTPSEVYTTFGSRGDTNTGISRTELDISTAPRSNSNPGGATADNKRGRADTPISVHDVPLESESLPYNWFSPETIQMFELSLFVMEYQKEKTEEFTDAETVIFRTKLSTWQSNYLRENPQIFSSWNDPYQLQPILTYLDIHLTFEMKSLFALINPPENINKVTSLSFNIDLGTLTSVANLSVNLFQSIFNKQSFFVPWWLNISQLFTVSLIYVSMINAGLKISNIQGYLKQCMQMWNVAVSANVHNPPSMAAQCLWCIKMLNHSICLRMVHSVAVLKEIVGADYGDNSLNKNKFEQFRKVGEEAEDQEQDQNPEEDEGRELSRTENITVNQPRRPQSLPVTGVTSPTGLLGNVIAPIGEGQRPASNSSQPGHHTHSLNALTLTNHMQETTLSDQVGLTSVPLPISGTSNSTPSDIFDDDLFNNLQWFDQPFV